MHRLLTVSIAVALLLVGAATPAWAQRTTATLVGLVVDDTGGALPGVNIELTNEATGIVDQQVTAGNGEFTFTFVPSGTYTVGLSIPGFRSLTETGLQLGAAQDVRRQFELGIGDLAETITVTGETPLIDVQSAEQRMSLETRELELLPAANRNITALLNIGVGITRQEALVEGGGSGGGSGGTVRLRLNGLGGSAMSITTNGTEASGTAGTRSVSSYNGVSKIDIVSIESVGEAHIVKGILPAEFGNALAGNLNIITKAGANAFSGSYFHRYEGAGLVAKPFFLDVKPEHKWNQGGGSFGGPIVRDRAFFFVAIESFRLNRGLELNTDVPTQRMRDLMLTSLPFPETQLLLDQYPLPTEPLSSPTDLLGVFIGAGDKENTDDHLDARADVRVGGGNLSGSFTFGHPYLAQSSTLPNAPTQFDLLTRRANVSYANARGRWSSESRFGVSYNFLSRINWGNYLLDPNGPGPFEPVSEMGRRQISLISFPGLQSIGGEAHIRGQIPSYSFEQQVTLVADRHAFKFGGIYATPRGGRQNVQSASVTYDSEAELAANRPARINARPVYIDSRWYNTNWGLFMQDDWRVSSNLVINMGVRYDYFGRFRVEGTNPQFPAGFQNLNGQPNPEFVFGSLRPVDEINADDSGINVGPRIGFAYNPDGVGDTVISGGWGLSFQPIDPQVYEGMQIGSLSGVPAVNRFSKVEVAELGLQFPVYNEDIFTFLESTLDLDDPLSAVRNLIDPTMQVPYSHNFTVGVQQALGTSTVVNVAYLGTRGNHFRMFRAYNDVDRLTGIRPNPKLSTASYLSDDQQTRYHSLQASLERRLSGGVQFGLHYTLSEATTNYDGDNAGPSVNDESRNIQDFFDISEFGPSIGDVTHNFIGDVIYQTPDDSGWLSSVQIAAIFRVRSGEPLKFVSQRGRQAGRPDVLDEAGAINDACCDLNAGILQYFNVDAFARIPVSPLSNHQIRAGNSRIGQFRLPGLKNLDLSVSKWIYVGDGPRIELRADILNALNWINYVAVQRSITSGSFGRITGTASARVVQVQARFAF